MRWVTYVAQCKSGRMPIACEPRLGDLIGGQPQRIHYVGCDDNRMPCVVTLDEETHVRVIPNVSARTLNGRDGAFCLNRMPIFLTDPPDTSCSA